MGDVHGPLWRRQSGKGCAVPLTSPIDRTVKRGDLSWTCHQKWPCTRSLRVARLASLERYWLNCYSEFELVAQPGPFRLIGAWSSLPKATAAEPWGVSHRGIGTASRYRRHAQWQVKGPLWDVLTNFSTGLPIGISLAPWFAEELAGLWRWLSLSRMGGMPAQCG